MRQVVLDTETTGLEVSNGHRIIEIGCVEILHRRISGQTFHEFVNPGRDIDEGALQVHGITREFLAGKPDFTKIADDFLSFIEGAELIIHNASFDTDFINNEVSLASHQVTDVGISCKVTDTLDMARKLHPGKKNSLDALCKRYEIDNSARTYHGALLDAQILADVYLMMTGGQSVLSLHAESGQTAGQRRAAAQSAGPRSELRVIKASDDELAEHEVFLEKIRKESDAGCAWTSENEP